MACVIANAELRVVVTDAFAALTSSMTQNRCVYRESACADPEDLIHIGMTKSRSQVCGDFSDMHCIDSIATWDASKRTGVCTGADYAQKLIAELFNCQLESRCRPRHVVSDVCEE